MEAKLPKKPQAARWVYVTPKMAEEWLKKNRCNRKVRLLTVQKYAHSMRNGQWHPNHQGVAFSKKRLLDGQHRLLAIVESGCTILLQVNYDLADECFLFIDDGIKRNEPDQISQLRGLSWVNTTSVAVARFLFRVTNRRVAHVEFNKETASEFLREHKEAIQFAAGLFVTKRKGISSAPVMTVFARAYYSHSHELLKEFAATLYTGITGNIAMKPAIILRDFLTGIAADMGGGHQDRVRVYRKTERALFAFLNGEGGTMKHLREATREYFPIPNENLDKGEQNEFGDRCNELGQGMRQPAAALFGGG